RTRGCGRCACCRRSARSPDGAGGWATRGSTRDPRLPRVLVEPDAQAVPAPHERHAEDERLLARDLDPAVVSVVRGLQAEREEALRAAVDQPLLAELLEEAAQLARRRRALLEVHEVHAD